MLYLFFWTVAVLFLLALGCMKKQYNFPSRNGTHIFLLFIWQDVLKLGMTKLVFSKDQTIDIIKWITFWPSLFFNDPLHDLVLCWKKNLVRDFVRKPLAYGNSVITGNFILYEYILDEVLIEVLKRWRTLAWEKTKVVRDFHCIS